jgi:hypothetical protein
MTLTDRKHSTKAKKRESGVLKEVIGTQGIGQSAVYSS